MPENGAGQAAGGMSGGGSGGATGDGAGGGTQPDGQQPQPTFETWYNALDTGARTLVDGHIAGLRSALQSERSQRDDLGRQVRDLAAKAEKGSDLERQLTTLQTTLQAAERRAAFAEAALRPEIGCVNAKAAYALAVAEDLFDKRGQPDWEALRAAAPELFRRNGAGNADGGAGGGHPPRVGMNEIIRRAAGRG